MAPGEPWRDGKSLPALRSCLAAFSGRSVYHFGDAERFSEESSCSRPLSSATAPSSKRRGNNVRKKFKGLPQPRELRRDRARPLLRAGDADPITRAHSGRGCPRRALRSAPNPINRDRYTGPGPLAAFGSGRSAARLVRFTGPGGRARGGSEISWRPYKAPDGGL